MPAWVASKGRRLLLEDVRSGHIPNDMDWTIAFSLCPEFNVCPSTKKTPKQLFSARLKSARDIIRQKNTRAARELNLLQQDLVIRPPPAFNHRGEPRWEGSVAQQLLKKDIAEQKHVGLTREQFHQSRPEYSVYSKATIAKKVEQEISLIKFLADYGKRRRRAGR